MFLFGFWGWLSGWLATLSVWLSFVFYYFLGGGFKYFLCSPLLGEMIQFDSYFSNGLKPPTSFF